MSDIALRCDSAFDRPIKVDWQLDADVAFDDTLESALIFSLFTDRRAYESDNVKDKRGWWANNSDGSRLYLLQPGIMNQETVNRAQNYCNEALTWMLDARVVNDIQIRCGWIDSHNRVVNPKYGEVREDFLGIVITLTTAQNERHIFQYQYLWESQYAV